MSEIKPKPRPLLALKPKEVSLVDKAANLREFIVTKRQAALVQEPVVQSTLAEHILKAAAPGYSFNAAMAVPEMRDKLWRATDALVCIIRDIVIPTGKEGEVQLSAEEQQTAVKKVLSEFTTYITNLCGEVITMSTAVAKSSAPKIIALLKSATEAGLETDVLDLISKITQAEKAEEQAKLTDELVEKAKRMTPARVATLKSLIDGLQALSGEFDAAAQPAAKDNGTVGNLDNTSVDAEKAKKAKEDEEAAKAFKAKEDKAKEDEAKKANAPVTPAFDAAAFTTAIELAVSKAVAPLSAQVVALKGELDAAKLSEQAKDSALTTIKKRLDAAESAPRSENDTTDKPVAKSTNFWGNIIG